MKHGCKYLTPCRFCANKIKYHKFRLASHEFSSSANAAYKPVWLSLRFFILILCSAVCHFHHSKFLTITINQTYVRRTLICFAIGQRESSRPPFYCEFMACIVLIVHVCLPSIMQTYSHRMFSLLPLPRLLLLYKMHVSKLTI